MSKQEATRLADALRQRDDFHEFNGDIAAAVALLERWPDGEPVALVADVYQSRYTLEWNGRSMPEGTPLFAAPPAESERIAALEAALKQAGEALDAAKNGLQWYRDRYPNVVNASDAEADEQIDAALRAIEEVRK